MTIKVLMPSLSPTMTEGTLLKWLIKKGDRVKAGDLLAEIETDKATMEVEAVDEGVVTNILVDEGSVGIPVNSTIAILDGEDDIKDGNKKVDKKIFIKEKIINNDLEKNEEISNFETDIKKNKKHKIEKYYNERLKISPYAKKFAKDNNINLKNISGSGPNNRIILRDLNKRNNIALDKKDNENIKVLNSMRRIIAERTTLAKQTIPHFYLTIESNVDKLLLMRKKINDISKVKVSINDILVKAIALAQDKNIATNVSWLDGKIIQYKTVDVSVAVALDEGLMTPIVRNANLKGITEISQEIKELVSKAKKGKLIQEEYIGGTISISNLGMFGISEFSAIINSPQSCILAVGAIKKMPVIENDAIKQSNILKSTLSADHRVLDGAVAGKLLKDFNDIIENPFDLWLSSNDMEII